MYPPSKMKIKKSKIFFKIKLLLIRNLLIHVLNIYDCLIYDYSIKKTLNFDVKKYSDHIKSIPIKALEKLIENRWNEYTTHI